MAGPDPVPRRRTSAGIVLYRRSGDQPEVLLGHMGGPYWTRREAGAWTIPKGEHGPDEDPWLAAQREFVEELGVEPPSRRGRVDLGEVVQSGGKRVRAWALEGDLDPADVVSGTFEMEWPPRSGRTATFPELDRVAWFDLPSAAAVIVVAQSEFLTRLAHHLTRPT